MENQEVTETETKKKNATLTEFKKLSAAFEGHKGEKDKHKLEYYTKELHRRLTPLKDAAKSESDVAKILEWERQVGVISRKDLYKLNEMTWNSIKKTEDSGEAQCKNKVPNSAYGCMIGDIVKFTSYWDEGRKDKMYTFLVPNIVEPEFQVSKELAFKIQHGFLPQPEDYAPPKTIYKRFMLRGTEFDKYFEIIE